MDKNVENLVTKSYYAKRQQLRSKTEDQWDGWLQVVAQFFVQHAFQHTAGMLEEPLNMQSRSTPLKNIYLFIFYFLFMHVHPV